MFQATTSGRTHTVIQQGDQIIIDDVMLDWKITPLSDGRVQIFSKGKVYTAKIIRTDDSKSVTVLINGHTVQVDLRTQLDLRMEQMGMNATTAKVRHITSPMPGLITDVKISAGDQVIAGTPLLVLEAMKMENVLQAPGDAQVAKVNVKKGDRVEKGQVLVEF